MSKTTARVASIDILRGMVMILMALDHTRDFFSNYRNDALDLVNAPHAIFITRWITHFCAPVFVFLAGTSAYLSISKGKSKADAFKFLFVRGLWLILLEFTIVRFGWEFNVDYTFIFLQVIWAIGWSMVFLSLLIFLPFTAILPIGLLIVLGHNSLDNYHPQSFGVLWKALHEAGPIKYGTDRVVFIGYPLVPWIGVMATGYCFGAIFKKDRADINKWLYGIGIGSIVLFVALRATNIYGDPHPWHQQPTLLRTVFAFIKCEKYPPSLLYLLMTIGPVITIMPLLEKAGTRIGNAFSLYGRVPMFYYILHIYLIHALALLVGISFGFPFTFFTSNTFLFGPGNGWGFPLEYVYLFWLFVVTALYYPCRWFARIKAQKKYWWLSYL